MKYYISDLHLFHENAIKFDHRPFESVQEMHEVILKNWNDRVTNGDFVYLLGDMSLRGKNEDLIAFVARLKGRKVLLKVTMMMCLITGINSYLLKFVIIKKFMIQLEKKNMDWYYLIIRFFLGKTWDVEKFCCMDIHMKVKKTGFIKTV